MIIFLDYTLNINYLLTNNSLLELSFNQILDSPNNLLFHINLNQNLKKNQEKIMKKLEDIDEKSKKISQQKEILQKLHNIEEHEKSIKNQKNKETCSK